MDDNKDMPHEMGPKHEGPHGAPMHMGGHGMHGRKFGMWNSWSSWTSPVGLGFFLLTGALAFAIVLYTLLNLFVSVSEAMHPADASSGMTQQQLQQELEQASPTTGGATGATQ